MQLPRKMSAQNVMASISRTLGNREHKSAGNEIRFAGDERKDKLYEPKHKQKLVRVLTVVAYVIFVSMAAILLSLYYTFLWDPKDATVRMRTRPDCASLKPSTYITASSVVNETQIEEMAVKSTTTASETQQPEITTERQNDLSIISTESTEIFSSSPVLMSENVQSNSSAETDISTEKRPEST